MGGSKGEKQAGGKQQAGQPSQAGQQQAAQQQQQRPPQEQWKHAVAGCTAGLSSVLVLHPLDVIKTRLQVQDGAGALPLYRGTLDAVRHIIREEGWRALYSGLTPALIGSTMAWGVYFFAYNRAKDRYLHRAARTAPPGAPPLQRLSPAMHLISAAEAGALVCLMTNPVWVVKTRLQLQRGGGLGWRRAAAAAAGGGGAAASATAGAATLGGPQQYRGFVDALVQISRTEGLAGLYKGLLPSLLLVSHGAIQLVVYEELKSLAQNFPGLDQAWSNITQSLSGKSAGGSGSSSSAPSSNSSSSRGRRGKGEPQLPEAPALRVLSSAEITAFGALSKMAASIATYPSQVVRSRLQQRMDAGRSLRYNGVGDVLRKTMAREGLAGFYKGLVPNVLRVMPQSALTFLVYESVMRHLSSERAARAASGGGGGGGVSGAGGKGG